MKKSRTLAIAIPLMIMLSAVAVYQYGYLKLHSDFSALKEEQEMKTKTLTKYISLISEKPKLEKNIVSLKETLELDRKKLIEGQTYTIAAASLQDTVKGIISGKGGKISSERIGTPEETGKFKIISVSIDAVMPDVRTLNEALYDIETHPVNLVVKELDVRIRNFQNPRDLMIKLDVSAMTVGK
jgi:hypothetical protein